VVINHNSKYFCLQCGSELFNKRSINGVESKSQECSKCRYTLLFGTIKKKLSPRNDQEIETIAAIEHGVSILYSTNAVNIELAI
jgi:DNA-directed RNA polymerase subunit RPC12/RpoP